jgi:filamentous hemagglutinin family protein
MNYQTSMTIALLLIPIATPTIAQNIIVPDETLGPERSIVQPRVDGTLQYDVITGGATRGTGLFHSFSQFNVGDRLNAKFSVSPAIQNIFARVTGGDGSRIDGFLGTGIDNGTALGASPASLFLLNPNGVVFGPNAKLDLAGAFLVTTASGFKFAGGAEFSAVNPQTAPLLTVSVPIGLQFGAKAGGIEVNGVKLSKSTDGQSLGLIGGNVKITDSTLSTITGQLDVGAVGAGESVGLTPLPIGWKVDYNGVKSFQDIQVDRSQINAGAVKVGDFEIFPIDLQLQGKRIAISDNSLLQHGYEDVKTPNLRSGKLKLNASESVDINKSNIFNYGDGSMSTPGMEINTGTLKLSNKSNIILQQNGGTAGNIDIKASQGVLLQDGTEGLSQIFSANYSQGDISGGAVNITTPSLEIYGGSGIATLLVKEGKAGDINLKVGRLVVAGERRFPSSIASNVPSELVGDTGNINILADSIDLIDGGNLTIAQFGQGKAGIIDLQVKGAIVVDDGTSKGLASSIGHLQGRQPLTADVSLPGVKIRAERLVLKNGGRVNTRMIDDGDSLGIDIQVAEDVIIQGTVTRPQITDGGKPIFSSSGISTSKLRGIGNGGNIQIRAKTLQVLDGGGIESDIDRAASEASSDIFQGKAGDILIVASDRVLVSGEKPQPISARFGIFSASNISSTVVPNANAQGGKISIQTGTLQVSSGAQIQSDMLGRGQAGIIEVDAIGDVIVDSVGKGGTSSAISSFASFTAQGNAGSVTIRSNGLQVLDGGLVSTSTIGRGNAGNVTLGIKENLTIRGKSSQGFPSNVASSSIALTPERVSEQLQIAQELGTNSSVPSSEQLGDGGTVRISARNLQLSEQGLISATSGGGGMAGDIVIGLRDRAILNNAEIRTSSNLTSGGNIDFSATAIVLRNDANIKAGILSGNGSGGNITLNAGAIVLLEDSDILAFAPEGQGGNITLNTQALLTRTYKPSDPASDLLTLDTNGFVDINATGATSGIITLPDLNPLQNNRPDLAQGLLDADQALSRSCLARNPQTGKFYITGAGGIPPQPGDPSLSSYSTLPVASVAAAPTQIVEADGLYPLDNGKFVFGKICQG